MKKQVLIIDNDSLMLDALSMAFADEDLILETSTSGYQSLETIKNNPNKYELILLDYEMPEANGDVICKEIKKINPDLPVIIISGYEKREITKSCFNAHADQFIVKGSADELIAVVRNLIQKDESVDDKEQKEKNSIEIKKTFGFLNQSGHSNELARVASMVNKYAENKNPVLIFGETGTGKEGVAKALHHHSKRKGEFISVNCGGMNPTTLESELFGHEKGAFTGAVNRSPGIFLRAEKGTVFLDEIGDMPLKLQVKLLRVLQEYQVTPMGSSGRAINIDVRIIAATHKNIKKMAESGEFREDLFYRLNKLVIPVPPLRERKSDIEPIAHAILEKENRDNKVIKTMPERFIKALVKKDWPGNIRELGNFISRAYANCETVLNIESIPKSPLQEKTKSPTDSLKSKVGSMMTYQDWEETIAEAEREFFAMALEKSGGKRKRAAEIINMPYKNFLYKLNKLNLNDETKG